MTKLSEYTVNEKCQLAEFDRPTHLYWLLFYLALSHGKSNVDGNSL